VTLSRAQTSNFSNHSKRQSDCFIILQYLFGQFSRDASREAAPATASILSTHIYTTNKAKQQTFHLNFGCCSATASQFLLRHSALASITKTQSGAKFVIHSLIIYQKTAGELLILK